MQRQMIIGIIKFNSGYEPTAGWTQTPTALYNLKIWSYAFKKFKNEWKAFPVVSYIKMKLHKVKHQSQQEVIIITFIWLLGASLFQAPLHFTVKKTKPL